jgi:hypothetical protein
MVSFLQYCSNVTAHNSKGGHVKPDLYNRPDSIAAEYGLEAAAEAAAFEAEHVNAIKDLVEKEKIDCDFVVTRAADVQLREPIRDKLKAGYDRLVKSGVAATKDVFFTSGDTAEAVCLYYFGHLDQIILTDTNQGVRSQRCEGMLHIHCWSYLALQTRPSPPQQCHFSRSKPPNTHSSSGSLRHPRYW